jgi:hypothetical protein
MLPESGGASAFTLLVADRLQDLGRPVTLDELVDAVARASSVPWSWIHQRYQQHKATQNSHRTPEGITDRPVIPSGFDPVLGWHVDGYDPGDPATRRAALRYCVAKVISNGKRTVKHHPWAIVDDDKRIRRNPDAHPRVYANGKMHDWDPATRASSEAEGAAAVKTINEASIDRRMQRFTVEQRATILRHLAGKLPSDRRAWTSGAVRGVMADIDRVHADASPDVIFELIRRYADT